MIIYIEKKITKNFKYDLIIDRFNNCVTCQCQCHVLVCGYVMFCVQFSPYIRYFYSI